MAVGMSILGRNTEVGFAGEMLVFNVALSVTVFLRFLQGDSLFSLTIFVWLASVHVSDLVLYIICL